MHSLFSYLLDSLNHGIILIDKNYRVIVWNRWMEVISGLTRPVVLGEHIATVCPCFAKSNFKHILMDAIINGQSRFCTGMLHNAFVVPRDAQNNQKAKRQNMQVEPLYYQEETYALIQISDITVEYKRICCLQDLIKKLEQDYQVIKQSEESAKKNAFYDSLTGLCNRNLFFEHLEYAMAEASRNGRQVALMFIDLDGFKLINDTYGHIIGDAVLKEVAFRLKRIVRQSDTVARFAGDEFTVILSNLRRKDEANRVGRKILESLKQTFYLEGKKIIPTPTASIGISFYPTDADNVSELIQRAYSAMYSVKKLGKNNYRFYEAMSDMTQFSQTEFSPNNAFLCQDTKM